MTADEGHFDSLQGGSGSGSCGNGGRYYTSFGPRCPDLFLSPLVREKWEAD
jgi:hypothetical protein